jgi:hypothetical protein
MARACLISIVLAAAACRPDHQPAPVSAPRSESAPPETPAAPSIAKVAAFDPSDNGNWAGTLDLSPAPASLVGRCIASGAKGWVTVDVETRFSAASKTSILEASPDTSPETRACIANALTGVHSTLGAVHVLLYVTFSPP